MSMKDDINSSPVKLVQNKIIDIYPFLTEAEKVRFITKSEKIIDKATDKKEKPVDTIGEVLGLLKNGHADIEPVQKPSSRKLSEARKRMSPKFKIEDRILIIKILSWGEWLGPIEKTLISFCVENQDRYDAILINVRNNKGGNSRMAHEFASIFFDNTIVYGKYIFKDLDGNLMTKKGKLKPNGKIFINKPIAILISNVCFSSNELFLAPFKVAKRATLIGEPTGGGSANPTPITVNISGKYYVVRVPTWRFFLKGKRKPLEDTKIDPDIPYKKDDIVLFAKNYLIEQTGL